MTFVENLKNFLMSERKDDYVILYYDWKYVIPFIIKSNY